MARTRMARLPWMIRTLFFQSLQNPSNSTRKQIFRDFFLIYYGIVCCVYSLESPHRGDSNEYTQHTIIVNKIEKIILNYRYLLPELVSWLTLNGSKYLCLERISMVPKIFEPLRFDCTHISIIMASNRSTLFHFWNLQRNLYGYYIQVYEMLHLKLLSLLILKIFMQVKKF